MNIAFVQAPHQEGEWNKESFPPLGLLYVATSVKDLPGIRVRIFDAFGEGLNVDQVMERMRGFSPDMVAVSITSRNFTEGCSLAVKIKKERPEVITVFGGIHATLFDDILLQDLPELDYVFRGESEIGFPEFCRRLLKGEDLAGVPGLSLRSNGQVVRGEIQLIQDLDAIPFPDRSLLEYTNYGTQWYGFDIPSIPRMTTAFSSRGCMYSCTFCASSKVSGGRLRVRSAEDVVEELEMLSRQGYEFVVFFDDNLTGDVKRLTRLCHMLIDRKFNMRFACAGTLHQLPQATLKLMHRAGFDLVFLGVESGSDEQLKRFKKPVTSEKLAGALVRARKARIICIASFITGDTLESDEDHEASKRFIRNVRPQLADINPLMVHPGSRLWDVIMKDKPIRTLDDTHSRLISRYPGQHKKSTIKFRENDFRKNYRRSLLDFRRLPDLLGLLYFNPLLKKIISAAFKEPKVLRQLFKGPARD